MLLQCHKYFIVLFQIIILVFCSEICENSNIVKSDLTKNCKWIEPDQPSIIVKGTAGRFGNILFTYMALLSIKVSFSEKFREINNHRKSV